MKRALLALILALPLAVSAQFRIVGTGLFTTINDSTYRAKIDFRPDLTGNSYNPTQLNDSMLVLSQKGQLYRLDSFYNASFSSAFIIVVEKNGNWGSPVGQVMVFQNNSSSAAPQAVYGANGATAGMQAGVDTWNALLLKVVSDSAVYWNQAYSNSIDSLNVSGDSLKTITLYRASGDSISATFVDGGGSGGGGGLTMPFDSVTFNVNETDASLRELKYSEEKGYLQYGGQDSVQIPILPGIWYVRNDTSVTIPKGTVLRATGTLGASGRIKVKHMIANGSIDAMYILGIAMHDIAVGADGYAMSQGKIRQVNTQAYSEGAVLYADVDTLGGLTQTEPGNGFLKLPIAFVVHSASNGVLAVRVTSGAYMRDLHDVEVTSPDTSASLYYNTAQGIWRDTTGAVLTSDTSVFARDFQISGTTNYLAKFTGSNAVGNSGVFESGGNIGIGITTIPYAKLNVNNSIRITDGGIGAGSDVYGSSQTLYIGNDAGGTTMQYNAKRGLDFWTYGGSWQRSVTLDSTGKLGIGTNAPVYKLHVDGEAGIELFSNTTNGRVLNFRPSLSASKYLQSISAEDLSSVGAATGLSINAGGGIAFSTNSSTSLNERMRITSAGRVGIGITAPDSTLHVSGSSRITGNMLLNGRLGVGDASTRFKGYFLGSGSGAGVPDTAVYIVNNSTSSGPNVGLAVRQTSPSFQGTNTAISGYAQRHGNSAATNTGVWGWSRSTDLNAYSANIGIRGEIDTSTFTTSGYNTSTFAGYFKNNMAVAGNHYGVYIETAAGGDYGIYQTGTGINYLASKLGIGTSTPSEALDVNGVGRFRQSGGAGGGPIEISDRKSTFNQSINWNVYYDGSNWKYRNSDFGASIGFNNSGDLIFANIASGTAGSNVTAFRERLKINENGNIGIATASPSRPLHVNSNISMIIPSGATGTRPAVGANGDIRYNTDKANFEWYSGTGWREPVNAARSPAAGLANRFAKFDANGLLDTSAILIQANNRIGIFNSPAAGDSVLTVTGGIMTTTGVRATQLNVNTSGTQVLSINNYSGNPNANPNNVFIGNGGQSATGSSLEGRNNIGIGTGALLSLTTGYFNLAIGSNALSTRATNVLSNIAIGYQAMQSQGNTQNSDNTAIGTNALRFNKGGNYNVALGSNALTQNTTSVNNDTTGVNGGSNNFGLGFQACHWNGTGLQNVGIGSSANYANRNGSYNIAIGGQALAGGTSVADTAAKSNNVAIGANSLEFLKGNGAGNSDENVAIGYHAGRSYGSGAGTNFTAGKTSVYIGAYTRANDNTNENEIAIGYGTIGNGSNTTTISNGSTTHNVFQYGEMLFGYAKSADVGDYRVQVNGNGYVSGEFRIGYTADQGAYPLQVNGQIFATNATIATSDARLKQDIEPLKSGLKEVLSLNPVTYTFKPDTINNYPKGKQVGFLAQEIQSTVQGDYAGSIVQEAGGYLGVADTKLIPLLVKAIQEQQAQIEALKKEIEALKNK